MLMVYTMAATCSDEVLAYPENGADPIFSDENTVGWVRYEDVEPLLKRLAELEAKEQKREQFDRESA